VDQPRAPKIQRGRATVLFADVLGYGELAKATGPDDAFMVVTRGLRLLEGVARRHGGAVDKYLGNALMAVFGLPAALEDAECAALRAALAMRTRLADYGRGLGLDIPLRLRIGVNTGEVVSGEVRGQAVSEFRVMGDAVNVAARLMSRAHPGAIYVGLETRDATRERFRLRPLGELELSGRRRRASVHELLDSREGALREVGARVISFTPHVGRAREREALRSRATAALEGRGGAALVRGPEGIGKSRLVLEFARDLPAVFDAVEVEVGSAGDPGVYAAVAGAGGEPIPEQIAKAILERARRRPLLLVVEDADRLAGADLETTRKLTAEAPSAPLFLVLVGRLEEEGAALRDLARSSALLDLPLRPLAPTETDELIELLTRVAPHAGEARAVIRERARGEPLRLVHAAHGASALLADRERETVRRTTAERRRATVLFADLTGFTSWIETAPSEETFPLVQGCLESLDEVARDHGGVVEKHLGDCVFATFGAVSALENSSAAAINAAIAMRRRVAEYSQEHGLVTPLELHCGIETGRAIAGDVSGAVVREYALMGESVDVASRLEDLAPAGAIYVGESAWRSTKERFEFRSLEAFALRGRSVGVYELLSEDERPYRARPLERSELVGREAEIGRLRAALAALGKGRGGAVSLIGEAGLGKSRLLEELRGAKETASLLWLEGRCLAIGTDMSFHPFADLLRGWAGIGPAGAPAASELERLRNALAAALPERAADLLPFLATVLRIPLDPPNRERLAAVAPELLGRFVMGGVRELLRAVAGETPVVLTFEDLHWADESSLELLESLLALGRDLPVLFVGAFRPRYAGAERFRARADRELGGAHLEVELRPLEPHSARRLIGNLFRGGEVPRRVRASIEARAAGNPFFAEEVVQNLLEEGAIELRDGALVATERIHEAVIPGSVEETIGVRIDRLEPERRGVLDVAAVIGGTFPLRILEAVAGGEELHEVLERMEEAGLVVPSPTGVPDELAFRHPLIHEVAYDRLLRTHREALHGRVGRAIEAHVAEETPGRHALLAYHFGRAGELERAERHLFRAGEEAAEAAASNEALHYFREAARLYRELAGEHVDTERLAALEGNVALALYNRGRLIEAVEHFDRALELLGVRVARSGWARNVGLAWNLLRAVGQSLRTEPRWLRPAATGRDRRVIELMFRRGLAQTTTAPTRFVADTLTVLHALSRVDPRTVSNAGGIYAHAAVGIFSFGGLSFALGRRLLERSRRVMEAAPERNVLINYRAMNFIHHFLVGSWSAEHGIPEELLERSLRDGRLWEVTTYLGLDAERLIARGEFETARQRIRRIDSIWETYQYDLAASNHYALPAYLALEERRLPEAVRLADAYYEEVPDDPLHLLALSIRIDALRMQGDLDGAREAVARGRRILGRVGATAPPFHRSRFLLAELAVRLAEDETPGRRPVGPGRRWRGLERAATSAASRVALRKPMALRLAGRAAWLAGRRRRALRSWAEGLAVCEQLEARPERARIRAEMAARLAGTAPEEAAAHGEVARQELAALGLAWDVERLRAGAAP